MTVPPAAPAIPQASTRELALRLARLHLRLGAHELARAELEAAAGDAILDEDALLDLAEVRWRTGDLTGAGVAANALLSTGRADPLAYIIAAEAAGAVGHTLEARRLAASALGSLSGSIDPVFAGMPRGSFWPTDHAAPGEPAGAFFSAETLGANEAAGPASAQTTVAVDVDDETLGDSDAADGEGGAVAAATSAALWADHEVDPAGRSRAAGVLSAAALTEAQASLDAGDHDAAAARLADLLRERPDLAATVLAALATGGSGRAGASPTTNGTHEASDGVDTIEAAEAR